MEWVGCRAHFMIGSYVLDYEEEGKIHSLRIHESVSANHRSMLMEPFRLKFTCWFLNIKGIMMYSMCGDMLIAMLTHPPICGFFIVMLA